MAALNARAFFKPDRELDAPVYMQLYRRFRDAISTGKLLPGSRVPSARGLASELHLARGTIDRAYELLVSEGYFQAKGPAGTFVSSRLEQRARTAPVAGSRPVARRGIWRSQSLPDLLCDLARESARRLRKAGSRLRKPGLMTRPEAPGLPFKTFPRNSTTVCGSQTLFHHTVI